MLQLPHLRRLYCGEQLLRPAREALGVESRTAGGGAFHGTPDSKCAQKVVGHRYDLKTGSAERRFQLKAFAQKFCPRRIGRIKACSVDVAAGWVLEFDPPRRPAQEF